MSILKDLIGKYLYNVEKDDGTWKTYFIATDIEFEKFSKTINIHNITNSISENKENLKILEHWKIYDILIYCNNRISVNVNSDLTFNLEKDLYDIFNKFHIVLVVEGEQGIAYIRMEDFAPLTEVHELKFNLDGATVIFANNVIDKTGRYTIDNNLKYYESYESRQDQLWLNKEKMNLILSNSLDTFYNNEPIFVFFSKINLKEFNSEMYNKILECSDMKSIYMISFDDRLETLMNYKIEGMIKHALDDILYDVIIRFKMLKDNVNSTLTNDEHNFYFGDPMGE